MDLGAVSEVTAQMNLIALAAVDFAPGSDYDDLVIEIEMRRLEFELRLELELEVVVIGSRRKSGSAVVIEWH